MCKVVQQKNRSLFGVPVFKSFFRLSGVVQPEAEMMLQKFTFGANASVGVFERSVAFFLADVRCKTFGYRHDFCLSFCGDFPLSCFNHKGFAISRDDFLEGADIFDICRQEKFGFLNFLKLDVFELPVQAPVNAIIPLCLLVKAFQHIVLFGFLTKLGLILCQIFTIRFGASAKKTELWAAPFGIIF